MFSRSRTWFGGVAKPKNQHSLEHLKYLCNVMSRNQTVSENNRSLLVETLRSIAEILIWGDQNDSSVFDFFLEKNMLSFFLRIMKQKCGSYVCVQLLQTLNILFENIRNETSLYYLLSNNHVNSIIVHKFDFSDEEVLAYYISFLKTLSLKLNNHTIHFFYNEHTNDFPLYTEAIKFFNHSENMVRIAVRTLTLNVYRVDDKSMLSFIRNRTAAPYFSNLVWFIGNHILEVDACVRNDADHQSRNCLSDLVAEHLDHLHYLNDILCLEIEALNQVLVDQLLGRLLLPLYVFSLARGRVLSAELMDKPYVSTVVSLFLTTQIYLIITHVPLVQQLALYILQGNADIFTIRESDDTSTRPPGFTAPPATLEELLGNCSDAASATGKWQDANITDEEKAKLLDSSVPSLLSSSNASEECHSEDLGNRPFFQAVFEALRVDENDYAALFALCFLYALNKNHGVEQNLLDSVFWGVDTSTSERQYNHFLVASLINIICEACQPSSRIRPVTVELVTLLVKRIALRKRENTDAESENGIVEMENILRAEHIAAVEQAREESIVAVRHFYKVFFQGSEEMFLDLFEGEVHDLMKKPLNVEYLMMDANLLLPPTGTPMTGIDFTKRLPCGDTERARRSIRVFLLLRSLCLALRQETETQLPLNKSQPCVQVSDVLDLNNSDLIACTVVLKDGSKTRRFLVVDSHQLLLVEPDARRLGWGVAKCVGNLQDVEVSGDKEDSRCLHLTLHRGPEAMRTIGGQRSAPLLSAKLIFDDHIRCMAAKQRLVKGRYKARQRKMQQVGKLLDLPSSLNGSPPAGSTLHVLRQESTTRRNLLRTGNMALLSSSTSSNALRTLGRGYPQLPPPRLSSLRPGIATLADNQGVRQRSSSAHPPLNSAPREAIPLENLDSSLSSSSPTPKTSEEQVL